MRRIRSSTALILAVVSAVLAGCAGGQEGAFTPVAGSDGAYCKAYRAWKVHSLDAGGACEQPRPAAVRVWWNEYLIAQETMLREAPAEIRGAVEIKLNFIRTRLTPVLEKYAFDLKRMRREGTRAEQEDLLGLPPPELDKAQGVQYAYEDKTCGMQPSPPAADVRFEPDASSTAFCTALRELDSELEKVASSTFDPDLLRALVTGGRFDEVLDGQDATAPPVIAEDVRADTEWFRTRWSDALAEHDYDIRSVYLDATPETLAAFNRSHPDAAEHAARVTAYQEQVCSE